MHRTKSQQLLKHKRERRQYRFIFKALTHLLVTNDNAYVNQNETDCLSPDDTYYYSSEFMEQVEQLESMAIEKLQQKKGMDFNPPSFSLRISPEKG